MTDNVTPAQLREDAAWMREDIAAYAWNVRVPDSELERLARAAAALERWAEALEQGDEEASDAP